MPPLCPDVESRQEVKKSSARCAQSARVAVAGVTLGQPSQSYVAFSPLKP